MVEVTIGLVVGIESRLFILEFCLLLFKELSFDLFGIGVMVNELSRFLLGVALCWLCCLALSNLETFGRISCSL